MCSGHLHRELPHDVLADTAVLQEGQLQVGDDLADERRRAGRGEVQRHLVDEMAVETLDKRLVKDDPRADDHGN